MYTAARPERAGGCLAKLRGAGNDDDIVISDVGKHKKWLAPLFSCLQPNTCIIHNGFAAMGMAVPGAVAGKLAHPDRRVVAVNREIRGELFCAEGFSIEWADQLAPAVRTALSSNYLSIIGCPVDVSENPLLTKRLNAITVPTGDHP